MKNLHSIIAAMLLLLCNIGLRAQSFPVETIMYNGPTDEKVNFLFLGDGYTASQQAQYINDVNTVVNEYFDAEPFATLEPYFNVYAVKVPSNVSGAAYSQSNLIDNYFGSTYWYAGIERLLVATKESTVYSVANASFPQYDQIFLIVNDSKYGGSGGAIATFSTHADATELALHEAGHSYAYLADEYWDRANEKPNQTANNNPNTIKWKDFLNQSGVGIYQYEYPGTSWYRPHQNCKMRYLGSEFCLVCQNAINLTTYDLAGSGGGGTPPSTPSYLSSTNIGSSSFTANWGEVADADSYDIQLWDEAGGAWYLAASTSNTSYDLTILDVESTQYWRVRAVNSDGSSAYSDYETVSLQSGGSPPSTPIDLGAMNVTASAFTGFWTPVSGATSYQVQLWQGSWITIGTSTTNNYDFTGLSGTDQWFRVQAINGNGVSDYSDYLYVELSSGGGGSTPAVPTNLSDDSVYSYGFYAEWDAVSDATSYEVQAWINSSWQSQGTTSNTYQWLYFNGAAGLYWRVRAINSTGASDYSSYIYTAIPAPPTFKGEEVEDIFVYPNPTNNFLYISHHSPEAVAVELYSSSGKLMLEKTFTAEQAQLDLSNFATGVYVIKIKTTDQTLTEKVFKF